MPSPVRVLVVDDHALVRGGLVALLAQSNDIEVVGEAAGGAEAVELAERKRPDIVVMDLIMPGVDGAAAARQIRERCPEVRVLLVPIHDHRAYLDKALEAGAAGYVAKTARPERLREALASIVAGGTYFPSAAPDEGTGVLSRLTPRQLEVLHLVAEGETTREIGQRLGISVKTVEAHRQQIMRRLGVEGVAGLVRLAIREGLVA